MMHTYDRFVHALQGVKDLLLQPANKPLRPLVRDMLTRILEVEGPPPTPIKDESYRKALILGIGARRRALIIAETWIKGPWRCLLLYTPSVALERTLHKGKVTDRIRADGTPVVAVMSYTPSRTQKFKRKIVAACRYFGLQPMEGRTAVISGINQSRSFLAWREVTDGEWGDKLQGDIDNYQKAQLDGLVDAGVLPDDRFVVFGVSTKANYWDESAPTMESMLRALATERLEAGKAPDDVATEIGATKKMVQEIAKDLKIKAAKLAAKQRAAQEPTAPLSKTKKKRAEVEKMLLQGKGTKEIHDTTGASTFLIVGVRKALKDAGTLTLKARVGRPRGSTHKAPAEGTKSAAILAHLRSPKPPSDAEIATLTESNIRSVRKIREQYFPKRKHRTTY